MATPYDATTKTLLELDPLAWVHLFGLPGDEAELIDAAGLRFPADLIERALRRIPEMKESVTYQLLVAEGRGEGRLAGRAEGREEGREEGQTQGKAEEAYRLLRLLGDKRFGVPSEEQAARIANETHTEQLEIWAGRLLEAGSWTEILA